MRITLIGGGGNMGRRYRLILKRLGHDIDIVEQSDDLPHLMRCLYSADRIMICTPTNLHASYLEALIPIGLPVLCEKPIVCNYMLTRRTIDKVGNAYPLAMVNQYSYLDYGEGETFYEYFNSGKDGLNWDCINIIGLARGDIHVSNDAYRWRCVLNGREITRDQVDLAYYDMLSDWIQNPFDDSEYILLAHKKAEEYAQAKSADRHPGKVNKH